MIIPAMVPCVSPMPESPVDLECPMTLLAFALATALVVAPQAAVAPPGSDPREEQPSELDRAFEEASARQYQAMRRSLETSSSAL